MTLSETGAQLRRGGVAGFFTHPLAWLGLTSLALVGLLALPIAIPIGPMYWDTYLYLDAAQRINSGQIPSVDFSAPVGPLVYYLFAWGLDLFPSAQLLLLAQWSLLAVTAPLMAVIVSDVSRRDQGLAFAILIPFLIFSICPANIRFYSPFVGLDGFGIYNRHGVLLLYVLTAGILFLKDARKLAGFCAMAMLALFLTKITAFMAGGMIGLLAVLAGRLKWRDVAVAGIVFAVPLALAEVVAGFSSAYISSIVELVGLNEDGLFRRIVNAGSSKLDVGLPLGLICILLFCLALAGGESQFSFFDRSFWWVGVAFAAGTFYEAQNTGSQEYIFLWPILVMIWLRLASAAPRRTQTVFLVLAAFAAVPSVSSVAYKTIRSAVVVRTHTQLDAPILKNMERVTARIEMIDMAKLLLDHYVEFPGAYAALASKGHLPSLQYYSEPDFQIFWILAVAQGAEAVLAFEQENEIRLETLMALDFASPIPWMLDRQPTKHIQIGADPGRTIPDMTIETKGAIRATDGILRPKCPTMPNRLDIERKYAEALADHRVIEIAPCWDLLLRPDLAPAA